MHPVRPVHSDQGVQGIRPLLCHFRNIGKTILLASHNAEDITALCDTVHVMDSGTLRRADDLIWANE